MFDDGYSPEGEDGVEGYEDKIDDFRGHDSEEADEDFDNDYGGPEGDEYQKEEPKDEILLSTVLIRFCERAKKEIIRATNGGFMERLRVSVAADNFDSDEAYRRLYDKKKSNDTVFIVGGGASILGLVYYNSLKAALLFIGLHIVEFAVAFFFFGATLFLFSSKLKSVFMFNKKISLRVHPIGNLLENCNAIVGLTERFERNPNGTLKHAIETLRSTCARVADMSRLNQKDIDIISGCVDQIIGMAALYNMIGFKKVDLRAMLFGMGVENPDEVIEDMEE